MNGCNRRIGSKHVFCGFDFYSLPGILLMHHKPRHPNQSTQNPKNFSKRRGLSYIHTSTLANVPDVNKGRLDFPLKLVRPLVVCVCVVLGRYSHPPERFYQFRTLSPKPST